MEFERPKFGVIGSHSMVGSRYCELLGKIVDLVKGDLSTEPEVDITDRRSVEDFFGKFSFSHVILFSAFTDVDAAEKQRGQKDGICWRINVEGARNIVEACKKNSTRLIFISTDFVFDGTDGPYSEKDQVGPNLDLVSWYGISKIEAEKIIQKELPEAIIIRIAYPYRGPFTKKDDIAKRILRLYKAHELYPMFTDQTITPTFIDDLAPAIALLTTRGENGIFHIATPEPTTQFEFATELIATFGGDAKKVIGGSLKEFLKKDGSTPRPVSGGLITKKIEEVGFVPTTWREGIQIIHKQSNGQLI